MTVPRAALIYTPLPSAEAARKIAKSLLSEGLIACANILGPIESVFVWKGELATANEVGVLFKTTSEQIDPAVKRLGALHPYEPPAIEATVCEAAHLDTLTRLAEHTLGRRHGSIDSE